MKKRIDRGLEIKSFYHHLIDQNQRNEPLRRIHGHFVAFNCLLAEELMVYGRKNRLSLKVANHC